MEEKVAIFILISNCGGSYVIKQTSSALQLPVFDIATSSDDVLCSKSSRYEVKINNFNKELVC